MSSKYIVLLDPSLIDNNGTPSTNLGDIIIFDSVIKCIRELFSNYELVRISTHVYPEAKHLRLIQNSDYTIIGGTNLLSSDIRQYNQWKTYNSLWNYIFPGIHNIILLGVGWWQYQNTLDMLTKHFYKSVLSSLYLHSIRDSYTENKLKNIGINNTLNTTCPTLWSLEGINPNHKNLAGRNCLFTLTDYSTNSMLDSELIELVLKHFSGDILFFPQGTLDEDYINSLEIYQNNKNRITILERDINVFFDSLNSEFCYIGTRLHAGIKCIEKGMDSLIIATDNRAVEISKDVNLPVVERENLYAVSDWIEGKLTFKNISLPTEKIKLWKNQFQ